MENIKVKNIVGHKLGITNPETRTTRSWGIDAIKQMSVEEVENLFFGDDGFNYMVREGYLELIDAPQDLLERLDLAQPQWSVAKLIALKPEDFLTIVPTVSEGLKSALSTYLENNEFPLGLAPAAQQIFGRDFLRIKQIKAEASTPTQPTVQPIKK